MHNEGVCKGEEKHAYIDVRIWHGETTDRRMSFLSFAKQMIRINVMTLVFFSDFPWLRDYFYGFIWLSIEPATGGDRVLAQRLGPQNTNATEARTAYDIGDNTEDLLTGNSEALSRYDREAGATRTLQNILEHDDVTIDVTMENHHGLDPSRPFDRWLTIMYCMMSFMTHDYSRSLVIFRSDAWHLLNPLCFVMYDLIVLGITQRITHRLLMTDLSCLLIVCTYQIV